jgi:hypothetical protein
VALICALPSDSQTLAVPVDVQLGAASASGASAIATALAPAASSGGTKLRIFILALLLCWPVFVGVLSIAPATIEVVNAGTKLRLAVIPHRYASRRSASSRRKITRHVEKMGH